MKEFQKPARLQPGDTVAVLSLSWGGPSVFPNVFDLGLMNLRELLGVIMPLGVLAEIDCASKTFRLVEACIR